MCVCVCLKKSMLRAQKNVDDDGSRETAQRRRRSRALSGGRDDASRFCTFGPPTFGMRVVVLACAIKPLFECENIYIYIKTLFMET